MKINCKSFEEWHRQCVQKKTTTNIVFGNGFSVGLKPSFGYGSLYEQAQQNGLPPLVVHQFEKYATTNFEQVLKELLGSIWLAELYSLDNSQMKADYESLKKSLLSAISSIHPNLRRDIPDAAWRACCTFLKRFNCIFTVNYDLLLYWATLEEENGRFNDGFSYGRNNVLNFYEPDATELGSVSTAI